ncbi:hypothetical protein ABT401_12915 [Streptomyces halstedii]
MAASLTAGVLAATGLLALGPTSQAATARQAEKLDRGVVSVHTDRGNLVSWRWLGTDPDTVAFNVYRAGTKVNSSPVTASANYFHADAPATADYTVRAVVNGVEQADSAHAVQFRAGYKDVPISPPPGGTTPDGVAYTYEADDASVADLDGDGALDSVTPRTTSRRTPASRSATGRPPRPGRPSSRRSVPVTGDPARRSPDHTPSSTVLDAVSAGAAGRSVHHAFTGPLRTRHSPARPGDLRSAAHRSTLADTGSLRAPTTLSIPHGGVSAPCHPDFPPCGRPSRGPPPSSSPARSPAPSPRRPPRPTRSSPGPPRTWTR